jgi:hypothetical protein
MKEYPKKYEDVFSGERALKKCDINKVMSDDGLGGYEYAKTIRDAILNFQESIFDNLVKVVWLSRKFVYEGKPRLLKHCNGFWIDSAFAIFMRNYVGIDNRLIFRDDMFSKIETYFNDFFEDFEARNPFEEKMKFPYSHITLEYLIVVYQMEERLDLLKIADDRKIPYPKFLDYVVNYISNYNEEHGGEHSEYVFGLSKSYLPYVQVIKNKKYEGRKRNKTRRSKKT